MVYYSETILSWTAFYYTLLYAVCVYMIIPLPLLVIYSSYDRAQSEWKTITIKSPSRQYEFGKKIDNNANKVAPVNKKRTIRVS